MADGALVQSLDAPTGQRTPRSFNLAQLADTLTDRGSAQLKLVIDDASTPVAFVRPRKLASGMTFDGESLVLHEAQPVNDGADRTVFAPWRHPSVLPFPSGETSVALPPEVFHRGGSPFLSSSQTPGFLLTHPACPTGLAGTRGSSRSTNCVNRQQLVSADSARGSPVSTGAPEVARRFPPRSGCTRCCQRSGPARSRIGAVRRLPRLFEPIASC